MADFRMRTGDMEHARMASLIGATTDLLNQLALLTRDDATYLWRIGGRPLVEAVVALKRSAADVRPQADALLARIAQAESRYLACINANAEVAILNASLQADLMEARDELRLLREDDAPPDISRRFNDP